MVRVNYLCALLFLKFLFFFRSVRFVTFRRVLDAEMEEGTQMGVTFMQLKTQGDEEEAVNNGEEKLHWSE